MNLSNWQPVLTLSFVSSAAGLFVLMSLRGALPLALGIGVVATVAETFRPALMASAATLAGDTSRVRSLALVRLASNLGMAVGPAVGGLLAAVSYRLLFLADGATCLLAAVVLRLVLHRAEPLQVRGATARGTRGASPFRDPGFVVMLVVVGLLAMCFFQIFSTIPLVLVAEHGLSEAGVGILIAINALLIVLFEMPLLRAVEHLEALRVAGLGALLVCGGIALLGLVGRGPVALLAVLVWTLGEMLALPMTHAAVAERAPAGASGRYMGAYTLAFAAAFVVGPALGGAVYQAWGAGLLYAGVALLGPPLMLAYWWLARRASRGGTASRPPLPLS